MRLAQQALRLSRLQPASRTAARCLEAAHVPQDPALQQCQPRFVSLADRPLTPRVYSGLGRKEWIKLVVIWHRLAVHESHGHEITLQEECPLTTIYVG
jgi:hypothetical protein